MASATMLSSCAPKSDYVYPFKEHKKWGFKDRLGNVILKPQFDRVDPWVPWGLDSLGKTTSDTLAYTVLKNQLLGFVDTTGQLLIKPEHEWKAARSILDSLAWLLSGDMIFREESKLCNGCKWGLMNVHGVVLIEPQWDDQRDFSEGLAAVKLDDKWGYINTSGQFAIKPQFRGAKDFYNGLGAVARDQDWVYIDISGRIAIENSFQAVEPFFSKYASAKKNGKWGLIDRTGRAVTEFKYAILDYDTTGFIWFNMTGDNYSKPGLWGLMDTLSQIILQPEFAGHGWFNSKGVASVNVGGRHYGLGTTRLRKRVWDGKWGSIDNTGKLLIEPK